METIEQGILIQNMSFEQYSEAPGIRSSDLQMMRRSPAHYRYEKDNPKEATPAMVKGQAMHKALLEPGDFLKNMVVKPEMDRRTKEGKIAFEQWGEFLLANPQAIVVDQETLKNMPLLLSAIEKHPFTGNLLKNGIRETSVFHIDEVSGELCKGRIDFLTQNGEEVDIKTTIDASPAAFNKRIFGDDYLYLLQASHYLKAGETTGKINPDVFVFVAIETTPPFGISVNVVETFSLEEGHKWRRHLIKKIAECKKTGIWPGYDTKAKIAIPPSWFHAPEELENY